MVEKLHRLGEVEYKNIFVDGTKIEANANRYTFVWSKAVEENLQKLKVKINKSCLNYVKNTDCLKLQH